MRFLWDEAKRQSNLHKHGFDFSDAATIFAGNVVTVVDDRFEYGEQRFATLGLLRGRVVLIIHTEEEDLVRIISLRKATTYEEQAYYQELGYGLGAH